MSHKGLMTTQATEWSMVRWIQFGEHRLLPFLGIWPQCRRVEDTCTSSLGVGQERTAELPRRFEGKGLSGAGKGHGCST